MRLSPEELSAGDHIYVKRKGFLYSHHGIYAGKGLVLHFKGAVREKQDPAVTISDMATFLNGGKLRRRTYQRRLSPSETLRIARAHLAQKEYSLVFNNCEHFATYCATGQKKSTQVHRIFSGLATLALATAGLLIHKTSGAKKDKPTGSQTNT